MTLGLAVATAVAITAPASAQIAVPRFPGGSGGRYANDAYQNGHREGLREGERDARDRKDYGFKRDDAYEDADNGYRGGSKSSYRADFRRGYEDGYDIGYRRSGGYRGNGGYGNPGGYPDRGGYPGGAPRGYGNRIAFDNGYADGLSAGRDDADDRRQFDPEGEGRYRSASRGYESRYGSRDWYRNEYRNGFRSGYAAGYRAERRDDRRR